MQNERLNTRFRSPHDPHVAGPGDHSTPTEYSFVEQQTIFSVSQSLVDAQKSRGFQYDGRTDPASGTNEESTQTDEAICKAQVG